MFCSLTSAVSGATGFVHHAPHAVRHLLNCVIGKRESVRFQPCGILQEVRLDQRATAGHGRDHARELNRRDHHGALADGHGNRFTRDTICGGTRVRPKLPTEPGPALRPEDRFPCACPGPGRRRSKRCGRCRDSCRRCRNRRRRKSTMPLCRSTLPCACAAMKHAAVESGVAGTVHACRIRGQSFGFEHGCRHHDLEDGAGSELRLNRAIEQRRVRIGIQLLPIPCCGMRTAKSLGLNVGRLTMARTSPVRASMATRAPSLFAISASAICCRSSSIVS